MRTVKLAATIAALKETRVVSNPSITALSPVNIGEIAAPGIGASGEFNTTQVASSWQTVVRPRFLSNGPRR